MFVRAVKTAKAPTLVQLSRGQIVHDIARLWKSVAPGGLAYRRALVKDVITAGLLGGAGDVLCQYAIENNTKLDIQRAVAVTAYSALYCGGFLHHFFKLYPVGVAAFRSCFGIKRLAPGSLGGTLGLGLLDNVQCALLYIPSYFIGVGLLQGDSVDACTTSLKENWVKTYGVCSAFWLPFMCANFRFIPRHLNLTAMLAANFFWSVGMDWMAHRNDTYCC